MSYLLIVESKSKTKTIESFLGKEYKCVSCNGHVRHIANLKDINTDTFVAKYTVPKSKQKTVAYLKSVVSKYDNQNIYIATDDDREGEAIAWHLCFVLGLDVATTKRIIFHEITKSAITNSLIYPLSINMNIVQSQQVRQMLDMLIGYKTSQTLWKHIYNEKSVTLSSGRCQTPALRLLNEPITENLPVSNKYKVHTFFFENHHKFTLSVSLDEPECADFMERSINFRYSVSIDAPVKRTILPPQPFKTSTLLKYAFDVLHLSTDKTTELLQTLYENGHITYARTENTKFSGQFLDSVETFLGADSVGDTEKLLNVASTNPHEAIRVVDIRTFVITDDDKNLVNLYKHIHKRTLDSCMRPVEEIVTRIAISSPLPNVFYESFIHVPLNGLTEKQASLTGDLFFFKSLNPLSTFPANYVECVLDLSPFISHHLSESNLLDTLENYGIGRPSTFSSIISSIKDREYASTENIEGYDIIVYEYILRENVVSVLEKTYTVGCERQKFVINDRGKIVANFLSEYFSVLFSYEYTKSIEISLDEIASGLCSDNFRISVCKQCLDEIKRGCASVVAIEPIQYKFDEKHTLVVYPNRCFVKVYDSVTDKVSVLGVKKGFVYDSSKNYLLENVVSLSEKYLGSYKDVPVVLKRGKYGLYISYGSRNESVSIPFDTVTLEYAIEKLEHRTMKKDTIDTLSTNILLFISNRTSVRSGKFGPYIFHAETPLVKPAFFPLKHFQKTYKTVDVRVLSQWIKKTYKINV